jgi:hypothetical protein
MSSSTVLGRGGGCAAAAEAAAQTAMADVESKATGKRRAIVCPRAQGRLGASATGFTFRRYVKENITHVLHLKSVP